MPKLKSLDTSSYSLFTKLSGNAKAYSLGNFEIVEEERVLIPPKEVIQAGKNLWSDYLVGFIS